MRWVFQSLWDLLNLLKTQILTFKIILHLSYWLQWNPLWEQPWQKTKPSGKAARQCKSKHRFMDFNPWWEATLLERPHFWHKRGGLTRGVPMYLYLTQKNLNFQNINMNTCRKKICSWVTDLISFYFCYDFILDHTVPNGWNKDDQNIILW